MTADIIHFSVTALIWLAAALCFLRRFLSRPKSGSGTCGTEGVRPSDPRGALIPLALTLTVLADIFLILLGGEGSDALAGTLLFCAVQTVYFVYIKPGRRSLAIRCSLLAAGFAAVLSAAGSAAAGVRFDTPLALAAVYDVVMLAANAADAARSSDRGTLTENPSSKKEPPAGVLFACGLALFLLCDICVGLRNLPTSRGELFYHLIWVFYLPSQLLIMLSYAVQCRR